MTPTMPILWVIHGYQRLISRWMPPTCRFSPSCSQYAVKAFRIHGFGRGIWYTATRVLRCNPFHPGGFDEVPQKGS